MRDVDGVVHYGLRHSNSHILCDHIHEEMVRISSWVSPREQQHPTCLWCVIHEDA